MDIKPIALILGYCRALPALIAYRLLCAVVGPAKALRWAAEALALVPGDLGIYARAAFYRRVCRLFGSDVSIGYMSMLSKADATLGDRVYLGRFVSLGLVDIAHGVKVADGAQLLSGRHHHATLAERDAGTIAHGVSFERITIGAEAWIGANAVVMADVGRNAIVAAGAVVTRPVPIGAVVAGVPARVIARPEQSRLGEPIPPEYAAPAGPHPKPSTRPAAATGVKAA